MNKTSLLKDKKIKDLWLIYFLLIGLLLSSCLFKSEPEFPFPKGLPEQNIVFMPYDPHFFHGTTKKSIGFVNDDGSDRELYHFLIQGGSAIRAPKHYSTYVHNPRWSRDGKKLVFSIADVTPNIRVIDQNGEMHGRDCFDYDQAGSKLGFDGDGRIIVWIDELSVKTEEQEKKLREDKTLIARLDIENCEIVDELYCPVSGKCWLFGVNISDDNVLTAMVFDTEKNWDEPNEEPFWVLIYDIDANEKIMFPGYHPSLSEDGTLLAYFGYDGGLRVKSLTNGEEQVLDYLFEYTNDFEFLSQPGWSPDQKWLVYNNRAGKIYKININTLIKEFVTEGFAPDWK